MLACLKKLAHLKEIFKVPEFFKYLISRNSSQHTTEQVSWDWVRPFTFFFLLSFQFFSLSLPFVFFPSVAFAYTENVYT